MVRLYGVLSVFLVSAIFITFARSEGNGTAPNIVFILVDDLGWSDLASYGHPWHETPRIDSLGTSGMRFSQAYAPAPICSASRASILTGKTTARLGFEFVVKDKPGEQVIEPSQPLRPPPFRLELDLEETTLAENLLEANFETAYFGKWHLNAHYQGRYLGWSPEFGPRQQGFEVAEEDFGSHPYSRKELATLYEKGRFHSDGITERAIRFLKRDHDKPFFLMVSHFYAHTPVKSPYAWLIEKYEKKIPRDIRNREKRVEYAAFLETLDHYVGQLLDGLEESGNADSTMVVFLSDNGGHPEYVSNKPLRGSKWNLYEGGIRVPMFVRWPGRVDAGSLCNRPVIGYDLFPTFAELAGSDRENRDTELDGTSFLYLLDKPDRKRNGPMYWHFPYYHPEKSKFGASKLSIGVDDFVVSQTRPQSAIRVGDFKLIYFEEDGRSELYDLSEDISEQEDLTLRFPAKSKDLKQLLLHYLETVKARRAIHRDVIQ